MWSKGATIDFDAYLKFCTKYSEVDYYVNLDVIPGKANDKRTLRSKEGVEESCKKGWRNYKRMLEDLPKDKVIPVYHQNDNIKWLDKYLNHGASYIGISPANDCTTSQKLRWMSGLKKYLFEGSGKPTVKTHGFAVTSYTLMKFWDWYSVDSASWKVQAGWGAIYVPRIRDRVYTYNEHPRLVAVSPRSLKLKKGQEHIDSMSPSVKAYVYEYLEHCRIPMGKHEVIKVSPKYKLKRYKDGKHGAETWHEKKDNEILRPSIKGVANSFEERARINSRFIKEANKVLPIKYIYFAGAPMPYPIEYKLSQRLLSYHVLGSNTENKCLGKHLESMRKYKESLPLK